MYLAFVLVAMKQRTLRGFFVILTTKTGSLDLSTQPFL